MTAQVLPHLVQFHHRTDAGRQLAAQLTRYRHRSDVLVLGLPRGGVPVAAEVARSLHAPLDVCLVRKLGVPDQSELAMGAIAGDGVTVINEEVVQWLKIPERTIQAVVNQELQELQRRERAYRGNHPPLQLRDRRVILVDDGIATGSTMRAAISVIKPHHPSGVVVATPVAPAEVCDQLRCEADDVVCLMTPDSFYAIGPWYEDFAQLTDDDVRAFLHQ